MELLKGETLLDILRRSARHGQPFPFGVAIYIASRLASALHHAHEARDRYGHPLGIVHRDVSPGNVMIRDDGQVCLIDFGVARNTTVSITEVGVIKGKLSYMSPEQCWGHKVDRRSDIFSLGILMYEMTTGRRLFRNGDILGTITEVMRGELPAPSQHRDPFPHELEAIITRALRPEPDDRFATAAQLQYELERTAARAGLWLSELEVRAYAAHLRTFGPERRPTPRNYPRLVAEVPTERQAPPTAPALPEHPSTPPPPPRRAARASPILVGLFIVPWILGLLFLAAVALDLFA
jgi:serine/threonine-protein kinase